MPRPADPRRNADLATIHITAKTLFGDVSKGGDGRDDYEAWMTRRTGKASAGKLTRQERIDLIAALRKEGLVPDGRGKGGRGETVAGEERPTRAQWGRIGGLARGLGWDGGLEDPRLKAFVKRTAKLSSTRFLTKVDATSIILGLQKMAAGGQDDAMS